MLYLQDGGRKPGGIDKKRNSDTVTLAMYIPILDFLLNFSTADRGI